MASLGRLLLRGDPVCPWWLAYTFDNPLRRLLHDPAVLLAAFVGPGMTAVDLGCGMGHFTLGLARLVGDAGKVVAVDVQERMLGRVRRRVERAGLASRVRLHQAGREALQLRVPADFALAFWMVHEVPDRAAFLREVAALLKPGARLFVAEPRGHVGPEELERTIELAREAGLRVEGRPRVALSRAVVFSKPG
ncbi:MAG TPA: class I SAM-dependent methyltransferase [Anaeromyxobacteraceae bacterium]|nr:class I SAM-dependent methyltransferase [Anaeromyxobacteraceae bacterium]